MELDRTGQEVKALHAAALWASEQVFAPRQPGELVSKVEVELVEYGRLYTKSERREPVWRAEPYRGRKALSEPTLRELDLRPWEQDEAEIERGTRHVALCGGCSGDRRVDCRRCDGAGRLGCGVCRGTGTRPAARGNRMVQCQGCRGATTVDCPACVGGRVECERCEGAGRLERWVEVTYSVYEAVDPVPPSRYGSGHPGFEAREPVAKDWEGATRTGLVEARGLLSDAQVMSVVPDVEWLEVKRTADRARHPRFDRVVHQTLTTYGAPVGRVEFDFSGTVGHVTLVGWEPRPTADWEDAPFRSRRKWVKAAAWTAGVAWAVGSLWYGLRDPFYRWAPTAWFSASLAVLMIGLVVGTASWRRRVCSTRRRNPFGPGDAVGPALGLLGGLVLAGVLVVARPSAGAALDGLEAGDLTAARTHVEALVRRGDRGGEVDEAVARLALAEAKELDNRQAVARLERDVAAMADPAPLRAELERLRVAWFERAMERGEVDEAGRELAALTADHGDLTGLDKLRSRLTAKRLAMAAAQLDARDPDAALALVDGLPEGDARAREVTVQAHQVAAAACGADVACAARALERAIEVDPSVGSAERLDALMKAQVEAAGAWRAVKGEPREQLAAIRAAEARHGELEGIFGRRLDLTAQREEIAARRGTLLAGKRALGEDALVAEEALRWTKAGKVRREGEHLVVEGIPDALGVRVHLATEGGVVVGALVVREQRDSVGLAEAGVQAAMERLVGAMLPARAFRAPGKGIRHVKSRVGRLPALFGWEDGSLVEVIVGEVTP